MNISLEEYGKLSDRIAELERENAELREALSCPPHWMHWISVNGRLPEPGSDVLAFAEDHCIYTALFDGFWWLSGEVPSYKVTYWMPLPEPPEVEDVQG